MTLVVGPLNSCGNFFFSNWIANFSFLLPKYVKAKLIC